MLQQDKPEDFVIATNEAHSIREFVEAAFKHVGVEIMWVPTTQYYCCISTKQQILMDENV